MTHQTKFGTLVAALLTTASAVLMPALAQAQCDATTIAGNWGTREIVFFDATPRPNSEPINSFVPTATAGRIVFTPTSPTSSDGTFTWRQVGNSGGVPLDFSLSGTYSVVSDTCTGTIIRNDGPEIFFVIVQGATEIDFALVTSQDPRAQGQRVGQGVMKRQ
jgi:hypothetical protein